MVTGSLSLLVTGAALAAGNDQRSFTNELTEIQQRIGGRLGVHVLDTASDLQLGFNDGDRFAMCSTFKLLLAAAVLQRADAGALDLNRRITFGQADMLANSPRTSAKLAEGAMSIRDLCAAAVEVSDNPAANLLLQLIEGPAGLTKFLRSIGDQITRLDRKELELNSNLPGDPRDTTTPRAMAHTVRKILTTSTLSESSRAALIEWLVNSPTGARRIRAGLPAGWKVGDKTGTGTRGAVNDVAVAWPPGRAPILVTVYTSESSLPVPEIEAAHAQVGKVVAATISA